MSENTQTVVERAREEAEGRWPTRARLIGPAVQALVNAQICFEKGATFAATVTPDQVEAAARALYEEHLRINGIGREWSGIGKPKRDSWRAMVHAAFTAAGFQIEADR